MYTLINKTYLLVLKDMQLDSSHHNIQILQDNSLLLNTVTYENKKYN